MTSELDQAREFADLFRAVYLAFHRRDGPRSQLPNASFAVLEHLALAGPLTIGEAAQHLRRAQSVVSEIVSHLEHQNYLERETDPADRRRTLIWLTPAGQAKLQSFEQRFERMTAWQARRSPGIPAEEIERQTLEYMATLPAWRDHPWVTERAG